MCGDPREEHGVRVGVLTANECAMGVGGGEVGEDRGGGGGDSDNSIKGNDEF